MNVAIGVHDCDYNHKCIDVDGWNGVIWKPDKTFVCLYKNVCSKRRGRIHFFKVYPPPARFGPDEGGYLSGNRGPPTRIYFQFAAFGSNLFPILAGQLDFLFQFG